MADRKISVLFPLFDGVTQLDFTGPHQVFSRAPGMETIVASLEGRPIQVDGFALSGLTDLKTVERCDVLCIPGGGGTSAAMGNETFMAEIRRLAATATYHTSVCTGSLILGAAGLLTGKRATSYWSAREFLPQLGAIVDPARVVRDGNVITGGGVTAGLDFAFVVVAELFGRELAETVQLVLEYAPQPPFDAGTPETASAEVLDRAWERLHPAQEVRRVAVQRAASHLQTQTK